MANQIEIFGPDDPYIKMIVEGARRTAEIDKYNSRIEENHYKQDEKTEGEKSIKNLSSTLD